MSEVDPITGLEGTPKNKNLRDISTFFVPETTSTPQYQPSIGVSKSKYNNLLPREAFFNNDVLEKTRAANQPFHHEMGRSLARMSSEIVGGTLEGFGYLAEMAQGNPFAVNSENILIDWGRGLKDAANESMPIHNANPGGYMFSSSENFWENFISLGSTLSLLAPTLGVTKGLSMLGKVTRAGLATTSRGAKIANAISMSRKGSNIFNGVTQAVLSRNIESNMEAYETYKSLLEQGVDEKIALESAKSSYINNWVMLLQDIPQYLALGKVFSPRAGKFVSKETLKNATKASTIAAYGKQALGEGFEEAYQYYVSQAAEADGLYKAGKADNKYISDIIGDSFTDSQFWNSVTMGAMGGAVFKAAFDRLGVDKSTQTKLNNLRTTFLEKRTERFATLLQNIERAEQRGNYDYAEILKKQWSFEKSIESLVLGEQGGDEVFNQHVEFLENLQNLNAQEIADLREMGVEVSAEKLQAIIPKLIKDAKSAKEKFDHFLNKTNNRRLAGDLSANRYIREEMEEQVDNNLSKIEKLKSKLPGISRLTETGSEKLNLDIEQDVLEKTISQLEALMQTDMASDDAASEAIPPIIDSYKEQLDEIKEKRKNIKDERTPSQKKRDSRISENIKNNPDVYSDYVSTNANINEAESLIDKLDLEYTKLFDERYRKKRNLNKIKKDLASVGSYNLNKLNDLEKEYQKEGLLGDSELKKEFDNKRKAVEESLKKRLTIIAEKRLDGKQLSDEERKNIDDYSEMYASIEKGVTKKREEADPKNSEPITPESSDEGTDDSQPQDVRYYEVQKNDLYPLIQPNNREQNPTLYDWIKSEGNKTNFKARFEIVDAYGGKAIRFTIVDKDGNDVELNGDKVFGFLRKTKVSALYDAQRKEIEERISNGDTVILDIKSQVPLMINTKKNPSENNIVEVFGEDVDLYYTNQKGEYVSVKTGNVVVFGKQFTAKKSQAGFFYAGVDAAGNAVPVKLNTKKLNEEQIDYVADVFEEMMKGGKNLSEQVSEKLKEAFPYDKSLLDGTTYEDIIDFFVYMNTKSSGTPNELLKSGGTLYFGNKNKVTQNTFSKESFKAFLRSSKRFNVKKNKLNDSNYREFVFSNKFINTDKTSETIFEEPGESRGGGYFYFDTSNMKVKKAPTQEATEKTPDVEEATTPLSGLAALGIRSVPSETEESYNTPSKNTSKEVKKESEKLNSEKENLENSKAPEQNPNGIKPTNEEGTNTASKKDEFGDELNDDKLDDLYC